MDWIRGIWNEVEIYTKVISFIFITVFGGALGFLFTFCYVKKVKIPGIEKDIVSIKSDIGSIKTSVRYLAEKEERQKTARAQYVVKTELYDNHGNTLYCTREQCIEQRNLCGRHTDMSNKIVLEEIKKLGESIEIMSKAMVCSEEKGAVKSKALFAFMKAVKKDNPSLDFEPDTHIDTYFGN